VPETCNFLDDDCDGDLDEGDLCPEGQACLAGECRNTQSTGASTGESPSGNTPPGSNVATCSHRGGLGGTRTHSGGAAPFFVLGFLGAALSFRRRGSGRLVRFTLPTKLAG
jgi:hypothetical protein